MKVSRIIEAMEKIAPLSLAEEWDNVGLLIGDAMATTNTLLLTIDLTPAVIEEARRKKARMVMAYHSIIFRPISRLTAEATPAAYEAARRGLAVYSPHTAMDSAIGGTNDVLAEAMGLMETSPLAPAAGEKQCSVVVFSPPSDLRAVAAAAFAAGAGRIGNYTECSFFSHGVGTFRGGEGSNPTIGKPGRHETAEELRVEFIAPLYKLASVCQAIRKAHSYETPAIDAYPLADIPSGCGIGRIGRMKRPTTLRSLIARLKRAAGVKGVLAALPRGQGLNQSVKTAACLAGSCDSIFRNAIAGGATVLVTGEMRHHYALEAAARGLAVICLGHSNSERMTLHRLKTRLSANLPGLRIMVSEEDSDPFQIG